MSRFFISILFLGLFASSCASTEGTQEPPEGEQAEQRTEAEGTDTAPNWYDHVQRSQSDSTTFRGLGVAASPDSSEAAELSAGQAEAHLEYAIDAYAEDVRRELAGSAGSGPYDGEEFILELRNAVRDMQIPDTDLETETEYYESGNGIHRIYTRVSIHRDDAINQLRSLISDDEFRGAL